MTTITNLNAGTHTWSASIADYAENVTSTTVVFTATGTINTNAPVMSAVNLTDEITLMPDVPEIWVQGKVSGQSSVVSASVNGGEAIPMNRRGDDFGFLLPLDYGKNVIVLYGADGQGNGSSKMFIVERTDKFRAVIESPGFGEFANGRELGVSGTVSAKYAEGTDEELGLAGVSVNGIAAALGEVDGNGNVGFATVGAVNSETACVGSIMPLIMELCWTNVNGELVFPGVDAVTNNCPQVPLGLLEGYEVVVWRGTKESWGQGAWSEGGWSWEQGGWLEGGWSWGVGFNKWVDWPNSGPCSNTYLATGGLASNVVELVASNCLMVTRTEWWRVDNPYYPGMEDCVAEPEIGLLHLVSDPWLPAQVVTNALAVGTNGLPRSVSWELAIRQEDGYGCSLSTNGVTHLVHGVARRQEETQGEVKFHAPFYYAPDTTVIFTLEGVSVPAALNITNLVFEIHGAVMVQSTPIAVNSNDVSYLVRFPQTGTNAVYTIDVNSFPDFASAPGDSDSGTNSWPYDCALVTFSNSVKSLSFTGFHNDVPEFTRAPAEGTGGNRFGYDEMEPNDKNDDHVSVGRNDHTYVRFVTHPRVPINKWSFTPSDQSVATVGEPQPIPEKPNEYLLRIDGKNQASTQILARIGNATGLPFTMITVNVYKEKTFEADYFRMFKPNDPVPRPESPPKNDIAHAANALLKSLVVKLSNLIDPVNVDPVDYDLNENGYLDVYMNGAFNNELQTVYDAARTAGADENDVVWLNASMLRNWRLFSDVQAGATSIAIMKGSRNKFSFFKSYVLASSSDDTNAEPIRVLFCDTTASPFYDRLTVRVDDGSLVPEGALTRNHPDSATIMDPELVEGLSPNLSTLSPMLVTGDTAQKLGYIIAHERGHGEGLWHVEDMENVMYRLEQAGRATKLPFRFKELPVVEKPAGSPPTQSQWEAIQR